MVREWPCHTTKRVEIRTELKSLSEEKEEKDKEEEGRRGIIRAG